MSRPSTRWILGVAILLLAPLGCKQQSAPETNLTTDTAPTEATEAPATEAPATEIAATEIAATEITAAEITPQAEAPPETLTIGNVAPELHIAQWVQGEQVDGFVPDHTYVVEFWATWCGPCRAGMPHIAELQKRYKGDVTFVGITAEDEATVEGFLEKTQNEETGATWREVADYTLALDADRATNLAYMKAAGQNGIPCAFIVGPDAHIEWIGHPARIDEPLEHLAAGTWNRDEFLARFEEEQRAKEAMQKAMLALRNAQKNGDWDEAVAVIDGLIEQDPDQIGYQQMKFSVLLSANRADEAATLAEKIAEDQWDRSQALNSIAWSLATHPSHSEQTLDVALRIAKRASELGDDEDAAVLDTVARIYFEQGNLDEAIAAQEKAVALDGSTEGLARTLAKYVTARDGDKQEPAAEAGEHDEAGENDGDGEHDGDGAAEAATETPHE